jgi:suppressor of G2 allele of SKP1
MIKSFQTSGGTVLSTDWSDIKSKDFEGKDKV